MHPAHTTEIQVEGELDRRLREEYEAEQAATAAAEKAAKRKTPHAQSSGDSGSSEDPTTIGDAEKEGDGARK